MKKEKYLFFLFFSFFRISYLHSVGGLKHYFRVYHFGTKSFISRSSLDELSFRIYPEIIELISTVCRYRFGISTKNIFYLFFRWNQDLVPTYIEGLKI